MKPTDDLISQLRSGRLPPDLSRRRLLQTVLAFTAAAMLMPPGARSAHAQARFSSYPFTLGVASGSPRADSVVLWTRLAPAPLMGGGMTPETVELRWELARDDKFREIVREGTVLATPELAHSVRVEADRLEPARWYWYRFMAGDAVSPVGRTRTAPAPGALTERLDFAFASCQQYEQGYYAAYRHMAREDLDLVVFLGDYIYESSWGRRHVRKHSSTVPYTLDEYRVRYAQYKSDPDLQLMHASAPWILTWDDHEVANDYANDRAQDLDPNFLVRRTAAYQAYYEHMPLRVVSTPRGPNLRLYDRYAFGDLVQFHVLDDRQYRSYQACPRSGRGGSNRVTACTERLDSERTLLGAEQEQWLAAGFSASRTRWNVIAQQTLMAQRVNAAAGTQSFWTDGWDGYPPARARLLRAMSPPTLTNPLVISGDVHCTWVADLKADFNDPASPVIATEFCGTSITSEGPSPKEVTQVLAENPHLRYGNGAKRGYMKMEIRRDSCLTRLRVLDSEKRSDSAIATLATFSVTDGHRGAERA